VDPGPSRIGKPATGWSSRLLLAPKQQAVPLRSPVPAAVLALGLCAACAAPRGHLMRSAVDRHVRLDPAVAACLAADAVRQALRFADPSPNRAAPVGRRGATAFVIAYEQDAAGRWLPLADHRLRIDAHDGAAATAHLEAIPTGATLTGVRGRRHERFELHVEPAALGCRIHGTLPLREGTTLRRRIEQALDLAAAPLAADLPVPAEPNLRAWQSARYLAAAAAARGPAERAHLLRVASRLQPAPAGAQAQLGALLVALGEPARARREVESAMLRTNDPATRAAMHRLLRDAPSDGIAASPAITGVDALALDLASQHAARRAAAAPLPDYARLARSHAIAGDHLGSAAASLLAREHAATGARPRPDGLPLLAGPPAAAAAPR
jgi:hypothetical protein